MMASGRGRWADRPMSSNPRQSWILDSRYWTSDSLSVKLVFRIQIVSGLPDSKVQDSGFNKQKSPGSRIPD